jgi:deoxyribonuclease V
MRARTDLSPMPAEPRIIAGADISFNKYSEVVYAGMVLMTFPGLRIIHRESVVARATFPYVPGLLAYREAPALIEVWNKLPQKPDLVILDGMGIAHPRRMGIAVHFGILADVPTMGCGKSLLCGKHGPLDEEAGSTVPLIHQDEVIGTVLRTKRKTNPVFVSPGYRITLEQSVDIIKRCVAGYRIPEPTRQAHLWVNQVRLAAGTGPS